MEGGLKKIENNMLDLTMCFDTPPSPDEMMGMIRLAKFEKYTCVTINFNVFATRACLCKYWEKMEVYGRTSYCGMTIYVHFLKIQK